MSCLDRGSLCPDLAASVYGSPEHSRQESLSYLFLGVFDLVYTGEWGVCVCVCLGPLQKEMKRQGFDSR